MNLIIYDIIVVQAITIKKAKKQQILRYLIFFCNANKKTNTEAIHYIASCNVFEPLSQNIR